MDPICFSRNVEVPGGCLDTDERSRVLNSYIVIPIRFLITLLQPTGVSVSYRKISYHLSPPYISKTTWPLKGARYRKS